jgi:hypothetical protein
MRVRKAASTRVRRPWWVGFALWGLPNRMSALACLGLLMWIAALSVFLGFRDARESLGVLAKYLSLFELRAILWSVCVLASLFSFWYLRAILWMDKNGGWPGKPALPAERARSDDQTEQPRSEPPQEIVS